MPGSARVGASFARLSFLLLVLLGTAGMHTMGHPPEPSPAATAHAAPAMPAGPDHDDDRHGPDPASVCVAVLLGGLALGLPALVHRRRSRPPGPVRRDANAWARSALLLPPARPPDPNRLSVLRI